jgi:hypothetical protein
MNAPVSTMLRMVAETDLTVNPGARVDGLFIGREARAWVGMLRLSAARSVAKNRLTIY